MKKGLLGICFITILALLALGSFYTLPAQVILEITKEGVDPVVVPKGAAVVLPMIVSGLGIYRYLAEDDRRAYTNLLFIFMGYIFYMIIGAWNI